MRSIATIILCTSLGLSAAAQTTITNGGFENWGNTSPGVSAEPTNWYSNKSGSSTAQLGPQTCFQDNTIKHSGNASVRVETLSGPLSTVVNGNVTTGVVNAPSFTKTDGYIGTVNYSSASDTRHMNFTGRPDSIVGWYQYTSGGSGEQAKIRVILHTGEYYDPETPTTYHPDLSANKVGDATFSGPTSNVTTWTRFSMPVVYTSTVTPTYIMISMTSSKNQGTTVTGSKFWVDDLEAIYNPAAACGAPTALSAGTISNTSAVLTWTQATGTLGSQYVVSTSSVTPTGSGTAIAGSTYTPSSLTPGTTYHAFVRDSCGATDLSSWVSTTFTTLLHPISVAGVTANDFSVSAFPNPVKNELNVKISGVAGDAGQVLLTDVSGRIISTTAVHGATMKLSMSGLSAGLYFVRYTDSKHTQTIRVTKQ